MRSLVWALCVAAEYKFALSDLRVLIQLATAVYTHVGTPTPPPAYQGLRLARAEWLSLLEAEEKTYFTVV